MDNKKEYEKKIDLWDLFRYLLSKWPVLLAAGIIVALLLGGYQYFRNQEDDRIREAVQNGDESMILPVEYGEIKNAEAKILQALSAQNAFSDSIYSRVASSAIQNEQRFYYLKPLGETDEQDIRSLVQNYKWYLNGFSDFSGFSSEESDAYMHSRYEVVLPEEKSGEEKTVIDGSGTLVLRVYGSEPEEISGLADFLENVMTEFYEENALMLPEHQIFKGGVVSGAGYNKDELAKITKGVTDGQKMLKEAENARADFSAAAETVLRNDISAQYPDYRLVTESGKSKLVKMGLAGFLIGVFLLIVFFGLKYLFSDTVKLPGDFDDVFGIPVLADFSGGEKDAEYQIASAAGKLKNAERVLFLTDGTFLPETERKIEAIADKLPAETETEKADAFFENPDALSKIRDRTSVVFVQHMGKVRYRDVERETETVSQLKGKLAGFILDKDAKR